MSQTNEIGILVNGMLNRVADYEQIIVKSNPATGRLVYLKDIARVELGSKDYDFIGYFNGKPATLVGIFLQPGANALDAANEVKKTMTALKAKFPVGFDYGVPYDTTRFVEVSIREVIITLAEASFP